MRTAKTWSDWADAKADLSLHWAHNYLVGFVMSRLISDYFSLLKIVVIVISLISIFWWFTIKKKKKKRSSLSVKNILIPVYRCACLLYRGTMKDDFPSFESSFFRSFVSPFVPDSVNTNSSLLVTWLAGELEFDLPQWGGGGGGEGEGLLDPRLGTDAWTKDRWKDPKQCVLSSCVNNPFHSVVWKTALFYPLSTTLLVPC